MNKLIERMDGPAYLTRNQPDPDAMAVLSSIDSDTALRLQKKARGEYTGYHSTETFLAPLAQSNGDVVLRVLNPPGSTWIFWDGTPIDKHYYGRVDTLPHYHGHKPIGRRNSHPDRIGDFLKHARPLPIHVENVPEPLVNIVTTTSTND